MHGRALYIGAPYKIPGGTATNVGTAALFERSGRNTGNLLIGHALRSQLDCDVESVSPAHPPRHRNYDLVAIAAANFLFSGFDFGPYADLIEKVDLPCLMVGLGAQAPKAGDIPEIAPGTKRFVKAVAARAYKIGVRGAFTAEVLGQLGVRNVELTGCPSFYLSSPGQIRSAFDARRGKRGRVSLNGSRNVIAHSSQPEKMKAIERQVFRHCVSSDGQFVLQSELEEMNLLSGADDPEATQLAERIITSLDVKEIKPEKLREIIRSQFKIFFDFDQWAENIQACSFSAGTRFHGNLIALLSGVPAHVICHDSRTQELCEFADVPHTILEHLPEDFQINDLQRETDVDKFVRRHALNYSGYRTFLERHGVLHTLASEPPRAPVVQTAEQTECCVGGAER
jgi:polysaccharide pyruvyl transferase WcaK-like protein